MIKAIQRNLHFSICNFHFSIKFSVSFQNAKLIRVIFFFYTFRISAGTNAVLGLPKYSKGVNLNF